MDKDKAKYFWDSQRGKRTVKAYLDANGNFTDRPSSFYIGTFTGEDSFKCFWMECLRRKAEHEKYYKIHRSSVGSQLGKYSGVIRRKTDWDNSN